jgi:peptidoglycan/xylan/chitin deacetylase (PgdA/CDA1 family)/tetratricopeptide (TPR) repeat protein
MMLFRRLLLGIAIALLFAIALLLGHAAQAGDAPASYDTQVGYTLHLLEAGRYGEAADAAQNLVSEYPDAAFPYELRGTTALYVGSLSRAQADFGQASHIVQVPETLYGLALCSLFHQDFGAAQDALTQASQLLTLSPAQTSDFTTARAYVQFLKGDTTGALANLGPAESVSDPLRAEIAALATYRTDPKAAGPLLTKFLAAENGVPRVREEDGLRPLFDAKRAIESSVIEPDLQQMYADRLAGALADAARRVGTVRQCSGVAELTPPDTLPSQTALISYSVDGQMAAMVNQFPYRYAWNTIRAANGTHTVHLEAVDASGNTLLTQTETVRVCNQNGAAAQDKATDAALTVRLWNLLRLRPCRKVAEWTLAQTSLLTGDRVSADTHLALAAALDPSYKDGRRFARALFGSLAMTGPRIASTQPIVLWTGNVNRKEIALTFDDGPNPAKTPALLDALDKAKAPATFFVVGSRAELAPELLRRMAKRGDEVENHSYTHPNMNLVIPSVAESEILRTCVLIQAMTGRQPHFFRPPGGNTNPAVQRLARSYGLSLAYWTVDVLHAEDVGSPQGLIQYALAHVHAGSIVLLHNGPDVTTAAVPGLVAGLRARGYKLVTLSEIARGQTQTKAGAVPKMKE